MKNYLLSLFVALACLPALLFGQKAPQRLAIELNPDMEQVSRTENNMRLNLRTSTPYAIYQANYQTTSNDPVLAAKEYLVAMKQTFDLARTDLGDLHEHAVRSGQAGHTVRFRQTHDGLPVNKNEITVNLDHNMRVQFVMNTYEKVGNINTVPAISLEQAKRQALSYLNVSADLSFEKDQLMIYQNPNMVKLVYQFILNHHDIPGEWEVLVDAVTGEIIKAVDVMHYHEPNDHDNHDEAASRRVEGTCNIWDPDPLAPGNNSYGDPGFVDGGDNTTPQLDGAMEVRTLREIDNSGGMHHLDGPWASIVDHDAPFKGLFSQVSSDFLYNRFDDAFEAVQCYYHLDSMMRYLNDVIGVTVAPYQYSTGVQYDPSGWNGADNSSYSSGSGRLSFGEGGVDDGEDSDVIHHELGHGLHDWITSGGLSQVNGLSEGIGDFVAVSYNRSLGDWGPGDPQYNWVFNWDGHNPFWPGRITNYGASYPGGLVGQVHTDGQIWATSNMRVFDHIGRDQIERAHWEGIAMTNNGTSQNDAANAVYQAAINMNFSGTELAAIHAEYTATGYTLPALINPPTAMFSADVTTVCLGGSVQFTDETTNGTATSWNWTFEGGTPGSSTDQHPTVVYNAAGVFDVTLEATNADGSNTMIKIDYITAESCNPPPSNNECAGTIDISALFGGASGSTQSGGPYDNTNATTESSDPADGWDCWGAIAPEPELNNTLWFAFVGDGQSYDIRTSDCGGTASPYIVDGDTQMAVYTGSCGALVPADCNEDHADAVTGNYFSGFEDFQTAAGTTYFVMIDGFFFGGVPALGQYCVDVTRNPGVGIEDVTANEFGLVGVNPNPATDLIQIEMSNAQARDLTVSIMSLNGQEVYNQTATSAAGTEIIPVNVESLASGMYILRMSDENAVTNVKFVVE